MNDYESKSTEERIKLVKKGICDNFPSLLSEEGMTQDKIMCYLMQGAEDNVKLSYSKIDFLFMLEEKSRVKKDFEEIIKEMKEALV